LTQNISYAITVLFLFLALIITLPYGLNSKRVLVAEREPEGRERRRASLTLAALKVTPQASGRVRSLKQCLG